ncbi:DNA-binding protein [Agarilytica rhodophyticola]|uniref:DNA-binding protein n=1 Tax=Agarilytica rhodophyticola TaxID=1737490 RepID=UPI000B3488DF|nr:DNA-binding protein [Agarilytica rhodophyticola]
MTEKTIAIVVPAMTVEEYACHVGVNASTVQAWVDRGNLPTIKKNGKCHLIDIPNLIAQFSQEL